MKRKKAGSREKAHGLVTRRRFLASGSAFAGAAVIGCVQKDQPFTVKTSASDTALYYHDSFLAHDTGPGHPENAGRLRAIMKMLQNEGLLENLSLKAPSPASRETVCLVHTEEYFDQAMREAEAAERTVQMSTGDVNISPGSWDAALLAAGAAAEAVSLVFKRGARNAFCAVRPPGHHARPSKGGMGFCIFNNIAIAARYAQHAFGAERILIVDWDVHHGNGTQDTFWEDGSVMCFQTHQENIYPGTGGADETGRNKAEGLMINCPLPPGTGIDVFENLYRRRLAPAAADFKPDLILVSAGFDSHRHDPLGSLALESADFGLLTGILMELAHELCSDRLIMCLEGGYNQTALAESVSSTLKAMRA